MYIKLCLVAAISLICSCPFASNKTKKSKQDSIAKTVREGDIVFQYNDSPVCNAIKIATQSKFSHCGLVCKKDGQWMVFEAIGPVRYTTLNDWIAQGDDKFVAIKRLKNPTPALASLPSNFEKHLAKPYDHHFMWDDSQLYCSELVWKLYKDVGIELCGTKPMKSYNLNHPLVQEQLKERYGDNIPYDEPMVSPEDIYSSSLLKDVQSTQRRQH